MNPRLYPEIQIRIWSTFACSHKQHTTRDSVRCVQTCAWVRVFVLMSVLHVHLHPQFQRKSESNILASRKDMYLTWTWDEGAGSLKSRANNADSHDHTYNSSMLALVKPCMCKRGYSFTFTPASL